MIQIMHLIPRVLASETVTETAMDFAERVTFSLEKTLLGLLRVFLVLAILYAVVLLLKVFFHDIPNRKKQSGEKPPAEKTEKKKPIEPKPVSAEATSAPIAMPDEDARLTAAITAAILAMRADSGESGAFRVVSFKRVNRK